MPNCLIVVDRIIIPKVISAIRSTEKTNLFPFYEKADLVGNCFALAFLLELVLLASLNIALFIQIRIKNQKSIQTYHFKKEQRTLAIILIFFELSYGIRCFWSSYVNHRTEKVLNSRNYDAFYMIFMGSQLVYSLDGITFFVLLLFHYRNFRTKRENGVQSGRVLASEASSILSASRDNSEGVIKLQAFDLRSSITFE